jgi:hypothetical protein
MKRLQIIGVALVLGALVWWHPVAAQNAAKRPLAIEDVVAFRALGASTLSPDGKWIAYRMAPQEGDADVIVRSTSGDKETKFPVGSGGGTFTFSDDSAWIAITTSPTKREADAARRTSRTLQNGLTLVNLATGEKTAVPKIRRFAFNGELGGWIALHRYGPDTGGRGATAAAHPRDGAPVRPAVAQRRATRRAAPISSSTI